MSKKIYFAAALFNGRECVFNVGLTDKLESRGYKTFLPQRDGFEFEHLNNLLENIGDKLTDKEISSAVQNLIYLYDMGFQLPNSDVVVANLDEPIDEGVVVEISYARLMGKPVIGFRTDVRSPYGQLSEDFGGMHFFPTYQCDVFIKYYLPAQTLKNKNKQLTTLVGKIDSAIKEKRIRKSLPQYAKKNPYLIKIFKGAKLLFGDINDIHSAVGLSKIVWRYCKNKKKLQELGPKILNS